MTASSSATTSSVAAIALCFWPARCGSVLVFHRQGRDRAQASTKIVFKDNLPAPMTVERFLLRATPCRGAWRRTRSASALSISTSAVSPEELQIIADGLRCVVVDRRRNDAQARSSALDQFRDRSRSASYPKSARGASIAFFRDGERHRIRTIACSRTGHARQHRLHDLLVHDRMGRLQRRGALRTSTSTIRS
ncbi:MAG: hypothetical protein MZU97_10375 [Bacillus subtilis]|nr:hypothetical protein [Bacillus subtilis]